MWPHITLSQKSSWFYSLMLGKILLLVTCWGISTNTANALTTTFQPLLFILLFVTITVRVHFVLFYLKNDWRVLYQTHTDRTQVVFRVHRAGAELWVWTKHQHSVLDWPLHCVTSILSSQFEQLLKSEREWNVNKTVRSKTFVRAKRSDGAMPTRTARHSYTSQVL